ncbi:putative exported protein [Rhodovulum sp. PH10]|nr:putative exported protein [Rhodovulum sp. PH10]
MSVGALVTVLGLLAVLSGIPNKEFDVGNLLITAGTTAASAGILLIGLAAVLRELRSLRNALEAAVAVTAEDFEEDEAPPLRSRVREPSLPPAEPEPPSAAVAAERLRASPSLPRVGMFDRPDSASPASASAPLPPQPPLKAPPTPPPLRRTPGFDPAASESPAGYRPPVVAPPPSSPAPSMSAPSMPAPSMSPPRVEPPTFGAPAGAEETRRPYAGDRDERARDEGRDTGGGPAAWERDPLGEPLSGSERKRFFAWTRRRQTVSPDAEAPRDDEPPPPERGFAPPPRFPRNEYSRNEFSRSEPSRFEPPRSESSRQEPSRETPAAEETVQVLKSGEIDGMRYTLYTDGSIDAEFEQGVLRFASIDDLRQHLEQNAG